MQFDSSAYTVNHYAILSLYKLGYDYDRLPLVPETVN